MTTLKWILSYMKPYAPRIVFALALTMLNTVLSNLRPYVTGMIVDDVFYQNDESKLLPLVTALLVLILVKDVFRILDHYLLEGTSQHIVYNIRVDLYKALHLQDFDFFDHHRTGDIMTRMSGDIDSIRHFVAWVVNGMIENAALFVSAIVLLCSINWRLTLLLLVITPVIAFFAVRLRREVEPAFRAVRQTLSNLNTVAQENISGNRIVRAMAREPYELEKFDRANGAYRDAGINSSRVWQKYIPYLDSLANSLNVIVLVAGGIMVVRGSMSVGEFVTFNSMVWALNTPMRNVGWLINDVQNTMVAAEKVMEFLNEKPHIYTKEEFMEKDRIRGEVEFRDVSFAYGDEAVLHNISFRAVPGQTIALLGETGSGKTSLVNLICRFYDATRGTVLIDGVDVREYNLRKLRQNISMAMQDIFLFSDTIEGNIAYGVPDAPLERVRDVAKAADADSFIEKMPEGYDTIVGERGVGLSGGQKQRIALARALLKDPAILILDDTTSSVDLETEHYIQETLQRFSKQRTTFLIAHRISAVKAADLILVLDHGEIVERGTHEELLAQNGVYRRVFDTQYGSFNGEVMHSGTK